MEGHDPRPAQPSPPPPQARSGGEPLKAVSTALAGLLVATLLAGCIGDPGIEAMIPLYEETADHELEAVAGGFDRPVQLVVPDDPDLPPLVAEMGGTLRELGPDGEPGPAWFDISDRLGTDHREQGLLGLALPPDYPEDPRIFITYTTPADVVLSALPVGDGPPVDLQQEQVLLRVPQPKPYHNGGHITFGPDGMLHAAFGDGAPQGDPDGHAQDLQSLLGTIIRIDVDTDHEDGWAVPPDNPLVGKTGRDEIWLYGLRNPWRFTFDPETGDLWIGDVGFLTREEVNRVPAHLGGGHNLGWPRWEGSTVFRGDLLIDVPVLFPVHEYPREEPCSSVTGGHIVRDPDLPGLLGNYVFADFCTGQVRALEHTDGRWRARELLSTGLPIAGISEGPQGETYLLSYDGTIWRLRTRDS